MASARRAFTRFDDAVERRVDRLRGNRVTDRVMYTASALGFWAKEAATYLADERLPSWNNPVAVGKNGIAPGTGHCDPFRIETSKFKPARGFFAGRNAGSR